MSKYSSEEYTNKIKQAVQQCDSVEEASKFCGIPSTTFRRYMNKLGLSFTRKYTSVEWENRIIDAARSHRSMTKAAASLDMSFTTFKRHALRLNVYNTNQGLVGITKPGGKPKYPLKDILVGKHPQYSAFKLKLRLFDEGFKEEKCESCDHTQWLDVVIPLELHHKNGKSSDHRLENLEILCPNCHALTKNYRGKNKKTD